MSLTKCPYCRRLNFVKSGACASCERALRPGELKEEAGAEVRAFNRRYNGLFAGLFLMLLAVLAFVVLRGT
jgi:hypothetical protein